MEKKTEKTIDELVMDLLMKVQQKKDEIKAAKKKPQWKTNCSIGYDSSSPHDRINIQVERNPRVIVDLYVFLMQMEDYMTKATKELGLPVDLIYLAYPIADWKDDLKSRAAQLSIDEKQKEMEALDKRVNKLVSPDQRRAMELKALQQLLR